MVRRGPEMFKILMASSLFKWEGDLEKGIKELQGPGERKNSISIVPNRRNSGVV